MRSSVFLVCAGILLALGLGYAKWWGPAARRQEGLAKLREEVEAARRELEGTVGDYAPKATGRLDDLSVDAVAICRQLPGVAEVEVLVRADRPTHRIIHVRDWHYVPKDLFAADRRDVHGRRLPDWKIDELYEEHLLEVELVQLEQEGVLRCLVKHHGLSRVLAEGVTPKGMTNYHSIIGSLRETDKELAELVKNRKAIGGEAPELDAEIEKLVKGHRRRLLEYGASGRLALAAELEVLPLDDDETLANARPVRPDGTVKLDPEKLEARHDSHVKAAMAAAPTSLLILVGSHDLSEAVRRAGGAVEYVRVTTGKYAQVGGG